MSSSASKKRPKPKSHSNPYASPAPSTSKSSMKSFLWEPPDDLFPSKDEFFRLLAGLAIAASVAIGCNFLANSFMGPQLKPFCDSGLDSSGLLSDYCEPCPSNGQCYEGRLECVRGYKKYGNLCVEDGDIHQTAMKLSEWIQFRLCESYAQYLCGGTGMIWVQEDDIWNDLDGHMLMERIDSDSVIKNYTKHKTMETVGRILETRKNIQRVKELKCPDVLAENYKPLSCRVHQWISNNVLVILPVFVLLVGFILLIWKIRQRLYLSKRVEELYQQICEILEENALMSKREDGECESWVVASRLRDHLLTPKERRNPAFWKKVEELVQEDSRVDRYPKLVKGESKVVWEWQVEGSLSATKMRKKDETSKLKSPKSVSLNSDQQHHQRLKTESKALKF